MLKPYYLNVQLNLFANNEFSKFASIALKYVYTFLCLCVTLLLLSYYNEYFLLLLQKAFILYFKKIFSYVEEFVLKAVQSNS